MVEASGSVTSFASLQPKIKRNSLVLKWKGPCCDCAVTNIEFVTLAVP